MDYAVLMMAYGGPSSLDDIENYLLNVTGGRQPSPDMIAEVREHYARIGGRSPLFDITYAQAKALEERLNMRMEGATCRVYVGMRHWRPYIREAAAQIVHDGLHDVVALCMAPHYSRMSVGAYFERLQAAQAELGRPLNVTHINDWHAHPLLIQAMAENIEIARDRFPDQAPEQITVIFTGHSLPAAVGEGDPYAEQMHETASLVADRLGLPATAWQFCYQSAGRRPGAWLGPDVKDVIVELAEAVHKQLLIAPIGFVADHVETLYDVDIECRSLAAEHGVRLERMPALNTSPTFIAALAAIVQEAAPHE